MSESENQSSEEEKKKSPLAIIFVTLALLVIVLGIGIVNNAKDKGPKDGAEVEAERRYPQRMRRPPPWLDDYVVGDA